MLAKETLRLLKARRVPDELEYVAIAFAFHRPPDEVRDEWSGEAVDDARIFLDARSKAIGDDKPPSLADQGAPDLE